MSEIEPPPGTPHQADPGPTTSDEAQLAELFHTDDDLPKASRRRWSHRGSVATQPFIERLLAPVTAVAVVIVVILLLIWINGGSPGGNQSNATVGVSPVSSPPTSTTAPTTAPATAGQPKHHHAPPLKPPTHHKGPVQTAMAPLTVLNNSTRTGLAHAVASAARHKGWHINQVGNLQGIVAMTTVYYARGDHAAAKHLAHDFASVQRVAPNHAGNIHGRALTLVVTRSWRL